MGGTSVFRALGEIVVAHQHNDDLNIKRMTHTALNTQRSEEFRL